MTTGISNTMAIAIREAQTAAEDVPDIKDRLRAAMRVTKRHWLCTSEDERFRSAIGGAMLASGEEDRLRIGGEMRVLAAISEASNGLPIDFSQIDFPEEPLGLLALWGEVED